MTKAKTTQRRSKTKTREKPLSAYPMEPDDILRVMLNTPPLPKDTKTKKTSKRKTKSKK